MHLCPAGNASARPMPVLVMRNRLGELGCEERALRPWADQRHITAYHVEQLRQFIEMSRPQPTTDMRAVVVGHGPFRVGIHWAVNGPELHDLHDPAAVRHPILPEEDRPTAG